MSPRLVLPSRLVLDASAFDTLDLDTPRGKRLRAMIVRTFERGGDVCCAAVTLAEVCRGTKRTRQVETSLSRAHGGQQIKVVVTDKHMAKRVGAILHDTGSGSERLGDAHVVAVCVEADPDTDTNNAVVLTSDSEDILALSSAVKGTKILVRDPAAL